MTSKEYFLKTLTLFLAISVTFAIVNIMADDFGLWSSKDYVRIWGQEKTSKYLLSFRYIPENFEGVIIGPSYSDNLDTRNLRGYKIYNLSMGGGNITEIKYAMDNVLKRGQMKYLIICLNPYITMDSGRKGNQIDRKEYFGSFYSFLPVHLLFLKSKVLMQPAMDRFYASEWGFDDIELYFIAQERDNDQKITDWDAVKKLKKVDPVAYQELKALIEAARSQGLKILAFYYPNYEPWQKIFLENGFWNNYKEQMDGLFTEDDIVWDMNAPEYQHIYSDRASYSDGHLSPHGVYYVIKDIEKKLNQWVSTEDVSF